MTYSERKYGTSQCEFDSGGFVDFASGGHHLRQGAAVRVCGTREGVEYALNVSRRAVLAELEFGFDAGDGNLEGDDVLNHLVAVVVREVAGPGALERRLVG